ncbi:MAG: effector binding domain-containing protein [Defluviitaleaceae bacterium]|nr:effector binding domain-containing protein [Defluviitaleaceae bacterium]
MDMRIEKRDAFCVSGYYMETSEETLERDCALLREKYEGKLRAISPNLYFVAWMSADNKMIYQLSVETPGETPEGMNRVEVPAGRFAVGTVPKGANILATWHEFFATVEASLDVAIDVEYPIHFEYFDENGNCELWSPIVAGE